MAAITPIAVRSAAAVALAAGLAGCGGIGGGGSVCSNAGGALDRTALVFLETPRSGQRVSSGFRVEGCSSTFEATVTWRLRARDGRLLAAGTAQGGGTEPRAFRLTVTYSIERRQIGTLEVGAPRVTTEGFPPVRNVVPLVLAP